MAPFRVYLLWLLFFFPLTGRLEAQAPFQHPFHLTEEDGLPENYVTTIAEDTAHFMWFGTVGGLCRYDGSRIRTFMHEEGDSSSLAHNMIYDLTVDRRGRLWVSTEFGFGRFDPEGECFVNYFPEANRPGWLTAARVNVFYEDRQGQYWIGSSVHGLWRFDEEKKSFRQYTFRVSNPDTTVESRLIQTVIDVVQDSRDEDVLWVATLAGLVRFHKSSGSYRWYYDRRADRDLQYRFNSMKKVFAASDGRVFVGSWGGAAVFDPKREVFTPVAVPDGQEQRRLDDRMVRQILAPARDEVWITYSSGLIVYDLPGDRLRRVFYNDEENNRVYGLEYVDARSRIWTRSEQGVFLYNPLLQQFRQHDLPRPAGQPDFVLRARAVLDLGEQLLFCVEGGAGLYLYNQKRDEWTVVPPPPSFPDKVFQGFDLRRLRDGRIFVLTTDRLYQYREGARRLEPTPYVFEAEAPFFRRFVEGADGELWIGSRRRGLYRLDLRTGRVRHYRDELEVDPGGERSIWIETLHRDRHGNIWLRTATGYSVFDSRRDTIFNIPFHLHAPHRSFSAVEGFVSGADGRVWVLGSPPELGWADPDHPEAGIRERFTLPAEARLDNVVAMVMDQRGLLWINHDRGVTRFDPRTKAFTYFSRGYGKPKSSSGLMSCLPTGEVLIDGPRSVTVFDPDRLWLNDETPRPYLTSVASFDEQLLADSQGGAIRLRARQNSLAIEFSSIGYNLSDQQTFSYRLIGLDQDWVQAGRRNYASYTHLDGGDYVFQLRVANGEGAWSPPLELAVHIATPWWRTWWFIVGLVMSVAGFGIGTVGWRIRQVRHQEQLKADFERRLADVEMYALRAQMNPHFIFNCLNSIDYYIIKNETEKASDYLNRFSRLIRLILQNSRANYVNLRDELEALRLYIEMESLRFDQQFDYSVSIAPDLRVEDVEIPPMLLQPYVENAIWHGLMQKHDKGRLDLRLWRRNGTLYCAVEDNGIGREAAQLLRAKSAGKRKSMGMQITRDRIGMINKLYNKQARVTVTDLRDEQGQARGTRVELEIPL